MTEIAERPAAATEAGSDLAHINHWINGRLVVEQTGMEWRKTDKLVMNNIMLSTNTSTPPKPGEKRAVWIDGIEESSERAELDGYVDARKRRAVVVPIDERIRIDIGEKAAGGWMPAVDPAVMEQIARGAEATRKTPALGGGERPLFPCERAYRAIRDVSVTRHFARTFTAR
jgi:hypothetical protein